MKKSVLFFILVVISAIFAYSQQTEINDQLFTAVKNNDLQAVTECIEKGADVNAKVSEYVYYYSSYTPLHFACENENGLEIARFLIKNGADVNAKDEDNESPLHIACRNEKGLEIARLLIENGADVNATDKYDETPLHYACGNENGLEIVKFLIVNGADVNATDKYDETPLHFACKNENGFEIAKLLIENGAGVNAKSLYSDKTPLHFACENEKGLEIARLLIENGANVNAKVSENNYDFSGYTPLHFALDKGFLNIAKLLIDNGAGVNISAQLEYEIRTPLSIALADKLNSEMLQYLINHGADLDTRLHDGNTAIHIAIDRRNYNALKILVENNADINAQNVNGESPLHESIGKDFDAFIYLLEHGANVNARDKNMETPLHYIFREDRSWNNPFDEQAALALIKAGSDVNAKNDKGYIPIINDHGEFIYLEESVLIEMINKGLDVNVTDIYSFNLLHKTVGYCSLHTIELLIEKGVDVNAKTSEECWSPGSIPLFFAYLYGSDPEIIQFLKEKGADMQLNTDFGYSPLHLASQNPNGLEIVRFLIEEGANVNAKDDYGHTPLHYAVRYENGFEITKLLIDNGAKVNAKDEYGYIPLHHAFNIEIARLLIEKGVDVNAKVSEENEYDPSSTPLHLACKNNNNEIAQFLIKNGADVNAKNKYNYTPLHYAIEHANDELVWYLISNGADLNVQISANDTEYPGFTPLFFAFERSDTTIIKSIIKNGADLGAINGNGDTYLHAAIKSNLDGIVKQLIRNGVNVNITNNMGFTPLLLAFQKNDKELVTELINMGADVNARLSEAHEEYPGYTPLLFATANYDYKFAGFLIEKGADVNIKVSKNDYYYPDYTPLIFAMVNKDYEFAKFLIEHGADVNAKVSETGLQYPGYTPLIFAMVNKDYGFAKILIENGTDVNAKVSKNDDYYPDYTPLVFAVVNEDYGFAKILIEKGADVNAKVSENNQNYPGYTPLLFALDIGYKETARLLIEKGADVNAKNKYGFTPLHLALTNGYTDIAQLLIEKGAYVNAKNENSSTLLHYTVRYNHLEIVRLLIEKGADVNVKSKNDSTLLHYAVQYNHLDIVRLLIEKGADVNAKSKNGSTALHCISPNGFKIAKILIENGADVNATDIDNNTPLHIATQNHENIQIASLLIEYGANVNAKNANAETPLHLAIENFNHNYSTHESINYHFVSLLIKNGANVNTKNKNGETPLHMALIVSNKPRIIYGYEYILANDGVEYRIEYIQNQEFSDSVWNINDVLVIHLLIENGADKTIKNTEGKTPVQIAEKYAKDDILLILSGKEYEIFTYYLLNDVKKIEQILNEKPQKASLKNAKGQTLWHLACSENNIDVLNMLLQHTEYINVQDDKGYTPYYLAKLHNQTEIMEKLQENGADINLFPFPELKVQQLPGWCFNGKIAPNKNWVVLSRVQEGGGGWNSYCEGNLYLFDITTSKRIHNFKRFDLPVNSISFSSDSKKVCVNTGCGVVQTFSDENGIQMERIIRINSSITLFNAFSGVEICNDNTYVDWSDKPALAPNGEYVAARKMDVDDYEYGSYEPSDTVTIWQIQNDSIFEILGIPGDSYCFSNDGKTFAVEYQDSMKMFTTKTWKCERTLASTGPILGFSPDDSKLWIYGGKSYYTDTDTLISLDISSGNSTVYDNLKIYTESMCFSPGGRYILSAENNYEMKSRIVLWDNTTSESFTFHGHKAGVLDAAFLEDTSRIVSVDATGVIIYWDVKTQERIITLYPVTSTEYVAVTPDGYFDGSEEALKYLYYQQGDKTIPLTAYYEEFYQPNLVQRILNNEPIEKSRVDFNKRKPNAGVNITEPSSEDYRTINMPIPSDANILHLEAEFTDNGGGIDEVRVFRNDKLVRSERNLGINEPGTVLSKAYDVALLPGINTIRVSVFNTDRTEISDTVKMNFTGTITETSELYVISIGINEYKNPQYHLSYAVNDALAFSECLEKGSQTLFGNIHSYRITDRDATKSQISATIEEIQQKAKPWDVFVFYYAGHGAAVGEGSKKDFYFIPYDVTNIYSAEQLQEKAITNNELLEYSRDIQAEKQFIIVDACNSGAAGQALAFRSGPEEQKAIAILARSTGTHFLFASTADQLAKEIPEIGHGVMTYAILDAMSGGGGKLTTEEGISVRDISNYTEEQVPIFSELYTPNKVAQYPIFCSYGQDFPLILPGEHINIKKLKGKYDDYSIEELEEMKMQAIEEEDYLKANEIKQEINKRNK